MIFFSSTAAVKKIFTQPQMRDFLISRWNVCRRSITLSNLSQFFRRSLVEQFISLNQSASALCGCFSSTSVEACRNCFEIFDSVSLSAVRSERFACSFRPALFFRAWCGISTNWSSSLMWLSLLNCNYTGLLSSSRQKWAQVQTDAHHSNVSLPLKLSYCREESRSRWVKACLCFHLSSMFGSQLILKPIVLL